MHRQLKILLQREGWQFLLACALVYLGFSVQLLGIGLSIGLFPPLRPSPSPFWKAVGEFGFNLTTISPLLALFALHILRSAVAYETAPGKRPFAWRLVLATLAVSSSNSGGPGMATPAGYAASSASFSRGIGFPLRAQLPSASGNRRDRACVYTENFRDGEPATRHNSAGGFRPVRCRGVASDARESKGGI